MSADDRLIETAILMDLLRNQPEAIAWVNSLPSQGRWVLTTTMERKLDTSIFETLIKTFVCQLGEGLISLVLFGSHARGEGSAKSDMDIFLLAENLPDHPFERQIFLRKIIPKEFPLQVSLYAKTVKEFERDFPAIYLDIAVDGLILFDKDNYAVKKLERIREIIKNASMKRIKKFRYLLWKWENQPESGWCIDWSGLH